MDIIAYKLPALIEVRDYHEFSDIKDLLNRIPQTMIMQEGIRQQKIKVKEIGFNGNYVGVIYVNRQPTKSELKNLFAENKVEPIE